MTCGQTFEGNEGMSQAGIWGMSESGECKEQQACQVVWLGETRDRVGKREVREVTWVQMEGGLINRVKTLAFPK